MKILCLTVKIDLKMFFTIYLTRIQLHWSINKKNKLYVLLHCQTFSLLMNDPQRKIIIPCNTIVSYGIISSSHLRVYFQAQLCQSHIFTQFCILCLNALSCQTIFLQHLPNSIIFYFQASILSLANSLKISCNEKQNID